MHFAALQSFGAGALLAVLLAPLTIAAPTETIRVPGGHRTHTNLKQVPAGGRIAHVGNNIHVLDANGTVVHTASPVRASSTTSAVTPEKTGWVTYASWMNTGSSPISQFTTSWTVPPVPETQNGQTVFLFNSIEPRSFDGIMQPVLQYGPSAAGGGAFWAAATWYLVGDQTFYSQLVPVNPGQALDGIISLVSSNGSSFDYSTEFTNVPGTALQIAGGEELAWATETGLPAGCTALSTRTQVSLVVDDE